MSAGGLVLVDKPAGPSSHDVVARVRRAARSRRVGHAGTLDPFATGLLVVAVGPVTRLLPYVHGEPKVYEATVQFGWETDTDDATGQVSREAPPPEVSVLREPQHPVRLAAEATLTGPILQVPPAFSAKHVDGARAYDLARRGRDVELPAVPVVVHQWTWLGASNDGDTAHQLRVRIACGGGTYIRALARDLGRALGSAAHCATLRRVQSGAAYVSEAVPWDALEPGSIADGYVALQPAEPRLLPELAREPLTAEGLDALRFGRAVPATQTGAKAVLMQGHEVRAIAERVNDRWQPRVVLPADTDELPAKDSP
ncbi:MAG: tRNA pseudouridine(55) synthase TruB [Gemmatimonas sp.]|nr:tRNA pseudouridine(55) synthase TruB [Gemmatimonas sp.]